MPKKRTTSKSGHAKSSSAYNIINGAFIDKEIEPDHIHRSAKIFPGSRITGDKTWIGPGCMIGEEAPATVDNCQLDHNVSLKGGYFSGSVFLSGTSIGSCAHIRPGCLIEEDVSAGHSIGLKQTVLMPNVVMGSLINFCDCLMSGGKDRKNHSEVGSSYVHFNFTPHQDKATASLIGDVPRGVMLNQSPIFLGGQGGIVGPRVVEYGTVIAAGTILRKDILEPSRLVWSNMNADHSAPITIGVYGNMFKTIDNCFTYLGNIYAMYHWYKNVRALFMTKDSYSKACFNGAINSLECIIDERLKRLSELSAKLSISMTLSSSRDDHVRETHDTFRRCWEDIKEQISAVNEFTGDKAMKNSFLSRLNKQLKDTYIDSIKQLDSETQQNGTDWLCSIVDSVKSLWGHYTRS